jgi:hypothetical protein
LSSSFSAVSVKRPCFRFFFGAAPSEEYTAVAGKAHREISKTTQSVPEHPMKGGKQQQQGTEVCKTLCAQQAGGLTKILALFRRNQWICGVLETEMALESTQKSGNLGHSPPSFDFSSPISLAASSFPSLIASSKLWHQPGKSAGSEK